MKILKEHRFKDNPLEQQIVEEFLKYHDMNMIIFGHNERGIPNDFLTDREKEITVSAIQWIMSPVGQGLLSHLGFELKSNK